MSGKKASNGNGNGTHEEVAEPLNLSRLSITGGGKARSQQSSFTDACQKGFEVTCERHPFFARKYLKAKIRLMNERKKQ